MSDFVVSVCGLKYEMEAGFAIDRPHGIGCFLLLRFHSPMQIRLPQIDTKIGAGDCILLSPSYPHWYSGQSGAWVNDWMHIHAPETEFRALAERYKVPLDVPFTPRESGFLLHFFAQIEREKQETAHGWEDAVELWVRQMLLQLGRALHEPKTRYSYAEREHLEALRDLRRRVHEQLATRWTIAKMAAEVGLSPSRFAALYQQFFEVSPLEDLLRARIHHAQTLLSNRAMSVSEAARQSGFGSPHHFSSVFHQRVGCAPRDYYRRGDLSF